MLSSLPCFCTFYWSIPTWKKFAETFFPLVSVVLGEVVNLLPHTCIQPVNHIHNDREYPIYLDINSSWIQFYSPEQLKQVHKTLTYISTKLGKKHDPVCHKFNQSNQWIKVVNMFMQRGSSCYCWQVGRTWWYIITMLYMYMHCWIHFWELFKRFEQVAWSSLGKPSKIFHLLLSLSQRVPGDESCM